MIELSLDNLSAVNISVTLNGGIFTMTVTAESSTDFNAMNGDFVTAVCDDDGEWQIVYRREAKDARLRQTLSVAQNGKKRI